MNTNSKRDTLFGTIAVVISSVAFGTQPTLCSIIIDKGVPESVVYMYFSLLAAGTFALFCRCTGLSLKVPFKMFLQIAAMAFVGHTLMEMAFSLSFRYIPVSMTVLFHFSYPAIVILIMAAVFKQKLTGIKIGAIVLAFAGVFLITDVSSSISFMGCFLAVASGLFYGIYIIANDRSSAADLPAPIVLFYFMLCSCFFLFIINLVTGAPMGFPSVSAAVLTALGSQTGCALPFFAMTYGVRRLGASRTVLLNNLEPLVGVVFSTLVLGLPVTFKMVMASICILGCSVLSGFVQDEKE